MEEEPMTQSDQPSDQQADQPSDQQADLPADQPSDQQAGSNEDLKKKFREALERKNSRHHASMEANNGSKISHAQGSASQKREFRRKSG
jgi:hypothetical protein